MKRTLALGLGAIALAGLVVLLRARGTSRDLAADRPREPEAPAALHEDEVASARRAAAPERVILAPLVADAATTIASRLAVPLGATREALAFAAVDGVSRGPASPSATAEGLAILDAVRGELRRFDAQGKPLGVLALPSKSIADAIPLDRGRTLLFDRSEAGERVSIVDERGRELARADVPRPPPEADADVSRVVVRGTTVYVERNGGGPLEAVLDTGGAPLPETRRVDGYPTGDGRLLLSAGITNEDEGRAWLNASDRASGTHVWTKQLQFGDEASAVGFLDDDGRGHGWVVVLLGAKPGAFVDAAICFETATGAIVATHAIRVDDPPWQSFRDFTIAPDGALLALRRSRAEARLLAFPCAK